MTANFQGQALDKNNIIDYIAKCSKMLEENNCPVTGSFLRFKGKDGKIYEVKFGFPIHKNIVDQFPDKMKQSLGLPSEE